MRLTKLILFPITGPLSPRLEPFAWLRDNPRSFVELGLDQKRLEGFRLPQDRQTRHQRRTLPEDAGLQGCAPLVVCDHFCRSLRRNHGDLLHCGERTPLVGDHRVVDRRVRLHSDIRVPRVGCFIHSFILYTLLSVWCADRICPNRT